MAAECAVVYLLDRLTTLIEQEWNLLSGIKEEVEYVRDELERMTAFLRVADAIEERDPDLKVWVKQVRDVAYDTEDVLDTYTHLAYYRRSRLSRFLYKIFCLKTRHELASEIKSIQSRVRSIAEGPQRYRHKFKVSQEGSDSSVVSNTCHDRRGDALLLEEAELVGIEKPKQVLLGCLMERDSQLKVVSVVGIGGSGKTTLVKKVYDDATVRKHFQNHAWVTVSQSFSVEELLKDLIQQLFEEVKQPSPQGLNTMNRNRLKATIKEFLRRKRYVLVFDDVWSIQSWEIFKYALPDDNCGSRVLLTTRIIDVASSTCIETDGHLYNMELLSEAESWTLFCKRTFRGVSCPQHLVQVSQNILKRCQGLPLAIVAIAGVLATKNRSRVDEWDMLNQSLGTELVENDQLESVMVILMLSFNDLPYYLKYCFLYLSVFPEDHLIERYTLMRLWISEGFVKPKEGRTLEEVAEGYLNELINRNLIQVIRANNDGSMKLGRIHDFLREIILPKSRDKNFVIIASEQNTVWLEKARRLSVHGALRNVHQQRFATQLRSILAFGVSDSLSMSSMTALFKGCRMLKVLDLRGAPLEGIPKDVFKLIHLRYLSLRRTKVKVLPGSIGKLQMLETLDLKQTGITELPIEILKLQRLRHLILYSMVRYSYLPYRCHLGFKAPRGIGGLTSLQKLCYMEANPGNATMEELETMTQLRRLCVLRLKREDGRAICSSIEKLSRLHTLALGSIEEEILDIHYLSSPPQVLQHLILTGHLERMPHWLQSLNCLVKVYLRFSKLRDDPFPYLQDLPNLVHLDFLVAYVGEELCFKAGKFQRLSLLDLDKLELLKLVRVEEGAMPHLEKLIIQRCKLLQNVPTGIERLANLKLLEFFDMPEEFILKIHPDIPGTDYNKVAHVPEVYHTYWRNDGWETYPLERVRGNRNHQQPTTAIRTLEQRNTL